MVTVPLLCGIAAALWALNQDRTYAASASFITQTAERGGGAAALAQQFGMNLGGEAAGESPQFYVDLLRSRAVLREAVESEYRLLAEDGTAMTATLIQLLEIDNGGGPLPAWRRAARALNDNLTTSVSRETGVVELTVAASHPEVAEQIAERMLEILNAFNTEVRQRRAEEEARFVGARLAEAQTELTAVENALQRFLSQNRQFRNSPELLFEQERRQRQVGMRQEVYTSLLRAQEEARIDAVRDTPLLTVIDHPAGSAMAQGRRTVMRTIIAFMLGVLVALIIAYIREATRRSREDGDPHYRELQGLARQAWHDVRHPNRWLRSTGKQKVDTGD